MIYLIKTSRYTWEDIFSAVFHVLFCRNWSSLVSLWYCFPSSFFCDHLSHFPLHHWIYSSYCWIAHWTIMLRTKFLMRSLDLTQPICCSHLWSSPVQRSLLRLADISTEANICHVLGNWIVSSGRPRALIQQYLNLLNHAAWGFCVSIYSPSFP